MLIVYKVRVKQTAIEAFKTLAKETLVPEAQKMSGCQLFNLYQNTTTDGEFIFHELWDNEESVHTYKLNLITILGKPHAGEEFPAKLNDIIEADEDLI